MRELLLVGYFEVTTKHKWKGPVCLHEQCLPGRWDYPTRGYRFCFPPSKSTCILCRKRRPAHQNKLDSENEKEMLNFSCGAWLTMSGRGELKVSENFGGSFDRGKGKQSQACVLIWNASVGKDSAEQGSSVPCEVTVVQVGATSLLEAEWDAGHGDACLSSQPSRAEAGLLQMQGQPLCFAYE